MDRLISCFSPNDEDVNDLVNTLATMDYAVYGKSPLTPINVMALTKASYLRLEGIPNTAWSEQKHLVKMSGTDSDGKPITPIHFVSIALRRERLGSDLSRVFRGLYTKTFSFTVSSSKERHRETQASASVPTQAKATLTARFGTERNLSGSCHWKGPSSAIFVEHMLNDSVVDELNIREHVDRWKNTFAHSERWAPLELYAVGSFGRKTDMALGLTAGVLEAEVGMSSSRDFEEHFNFELIVESYGSEDLTNPPRAQLIRTGAAPSAWGHVVNLSVEIQRLYDLSKDASERYNLFFAPPERLDSPFKLILVGDRGDGKSSVALGIQIAEEGWKRPCGGIRVRELTDVSEIGGTQTSSLLSVAATQRTNFCQVCDTAGAKALKTLGKAEFPVLVLDASKVFDKDGEVSAGFVRGMDDSPNLKVAVMILLTKWDMLLYDTPVTEPIALVKRLDEMWQDTTKLKGIRRCCDKLLRTLGNRNVKVRYHRTPIVTDEPPSLEHVQQIQRMSVEMLEDFLSIVKERFERALGTQ